MAQAAPSSNVVISGVLYAGVKIKAVGVGELGTLTWEHNALYQEALLPGTDAGKVNQAWSYKFDCDAVSPMSIDLSTIVASLSSNNRADATNGSTVSVMGIYIKHCGDATQTGNVTIAPASEGGCALLQGVLYPGGVLFGAFGDGPELGANTSMVFSSSSGIVPVQITVVGR